ncbi:hypothetical protein R6U76_09240 [Lysinibacillus capsici]|uniref:hypothetical protein n=1 Tax=Lysinibacillus capsici TaxID=2115968 RepID=UPI0029DE621A|nr:hypothetical protein [Lysinibacillus capsici]WPK07241.1 hypothetical protein R6U76_09240 [Lysinibacillus capsici]
MKTFYHCLIMWIPFIVLFALAGFGLEVLEGRKIRTSEYMTGFRDLGVGYMFLMGSFAFYSLSDFVFTANIYCESFYEKLAV